MDIIAHNPKPWQTEVCPFKLLVYKLEYKYNVRLVLVPWIAMFVCSKEMTNAKEKNYLCQWEPAAHSAVMFYSTGSVDLLWSSEEGRTSHWAAEWWSTSDWERCVCCNTTLKITWISQIKLSCDTHPTLWFIDQCYHDPSSNTGANVAEVHTRLQMRNQTRWQTCKWASSSKDPNV